VARRHHLIRLREEGERFRRTRERRRDGLQREIAVLGTDEDPHGWEQPLPEDPAASHDPIGRALRDDVLASLPPGWSLEGRRVLDFDVCVNGETPPLSHDDGCFDLVLAISVFTHLTERWSDWLLELHRVLRRDGLLAATFADQAAFRDPFQEHWREDETGMNVLRPWQARGCGGPTVYHSEWWIRAHWGRAFEVVSLTPHGPVREGAREGVAVMRPRLVTLTPHDLERDEPDEPRELDARRHNLRQLRREGQQIRAHWDRVLEPLEREAEELRARRGGRSEKDGRETGKET
jgi:hypothetical protein